MHPLDGIRLKLIRAEQHLNATWEFFKPLRYGKLQIVSEYDPESGMIHLRAHLPKTGLEPSIIIGDCLYSMRSSLDHLVWQLVMVNGQNGTKQNQFPICDTPAGFQARIKRGQLNGVPPSAVPLIDGLQPYQRGQTGRHMHPLWILNELTNIDKHRTLALTTVWASDYQCGIAGPAGFRISAVGPPGWGAIEDGAEFFSWRPDTVGRSEDMDVDGQASMFVAFKDQPAAKLEVVVTLKSMLDFIKQDVIPSFEPFFN